MMAIDLVDNKMALANTQRARNYCLLRNGKGKPIHVARLLPVHFSKENKLGPGCHILSNFQHVNPLHVYLMSFLTF